MFVCPVVCVQDLDAAMAALAGGNRVVLLSPPRAGITHGVGWWRALVAAAGPAERIAADVLDCGEAPGRAMEALRAGCRHVVLAPDCPAFAAVAGAAAACGAVVLAARPEDSAGPRDKAGDLA